MRKIAMSAVALLTATGVLDTWISEWGWLVYFRCEAEWRGGELTS